MLLSIPLLWVAGCSDPSKLPDQCTTAVDCDSRVCDTALGTCLAPACDDQVHNGSETDLDCGGVCDPCTDGAMCGQGGDCESQVCEGQVCAAARCGDGVVNQPGEVCDDGNADNSDDCTAVCELADCADGFMNGDESDVDCGGHCGPRSCRVGQLCTSDDHCVSDSCQAGVCGAIPETLVVGAFHSCALDSAGAVRCWGANGNGELGYGHQMSIGDDELPVTAGTVDVGGTAVQLTAGVYFTCALLDTGAVRCWGDNQYGQLGQGHTDDIGDDELPSTAGDIQLGGAAVQIDAGSRHVCALMQTGAVRCWGYNWIGQLGLGHTDNIGDDESPSTAGDIQLGGTAVQISVGSEFNCARLDTGAVRCWGRNETGQLGYGHLQPIGDDELPDSAGELSLGGTAVQITTGQRHACALLQTGAVRCWGGNGYGQLGYGHILRIGDDELPDAAGPVLLPDPVASVVAGENHTCARSVAGGLRCWGRNAWGQLGYGRTDNIGDDELPAIAGEVDIGGAVVQAALGAHTCARLAGGAIRCWGYNGNGQLGYGHVENIGDDELPSSAGDVQYQ